MKLISEFREEKLVQKVLGEIKKVLKNKWNIMEVCGGQTHNFLKFGIEELLPPEINLLHGPGCPVCVTDVEFIEKALYLASQKNIIFCTYGDMMRVPGIEKDLFQIKAEGGDVRAVLSPMDALKIAKENPQKEVVFFGIGFETTAPGNALSILKAKKENIKNFSVLSSMVRVPPALKLLLSSPYVKINGFLAAGHVCTVMGYEEYIPISLRYNVPIVVTGFEPFDLLYGIFLCVKLLEEGKAEVQNAYKRSVKKEGNLEAKKVMKEVYEIVDRKWRGIGIVPEGGFAIKKEYSEFDAEKKFNLKDFRKEEKTKCISGLVLQGIKKPSECPLFGNPCTPENPLGATMVSSEGACQAYYLYKEYEEKK
ncbi:MAG: hydrogenase formation protein HypD [Thermoanaerobaculia bacterium]